MRLRNKLSGSLLYDVHGRSQKDFAILKTQFSSLLSLFPKISEFRFILTVGSQDYLWKERVKVYLVTQDVVAT